MTTVHYSTGGQFSTCGLPLAVVFDGESPSYSDRLSEVNCADCLGNPRPRERAMIDALNEVSRTAAALGANQPPIMGTRAKLLDAHLEAYGKAVRLVVEAELDAR